MVKIKMVTPNTRSSKMRNLTRNLTFTSNLGTISSSQKLEAVTNLTATRRGPSGILAQEIIYVYFNVPNINDIKFVTIKWKPVTDYYPVSFSSNKLLVIKNNMDYSINTSVFEDDNNKRSFGNGYGYQWDIRVTYTINTGEESEMASRVSEKYA